MGAGGTVPRRLPELCETLKGMRVYPRTLLLLMALLLYNDGVTTVIAAATVYGSEELALDQTVLIAAILLVQFVAFGGALALGRIAQRIGAKRTVPGSLVVWVAVVAYGRVLPPRDVRP